MLVVSLDSVLVISLVLCPVLEYGGALIRCICFLSVVIGLGSRALGCRRAGSWHPFCEN